MGRVPLGARPIFILSKICDSGSRGVTPARMLRALGALVSLVLLLTLAAAGCVEAFGDKNPHEPGDALGTFHITAKQTQNSCGDGALGAPPVWEFDVKLSWAEDSIFWNSGGEVIPGTLSDDRASFEIASDVVMNMRTEADAGKKPCSIARHDEAKGKLVAQGEGVASVSGTLSYAYTPTSGSDCTDLVASEAPLFAALPCAMTYSFEAPRTGD
jgi:hypothetical protein